MVGLKDVIVADRFLGIHLLNDPDGFFLPHMGRAHLWIHQQFSSIEQDKAIKEKIDEEVYDCGQLYSPDLIDEIREALIKQLSDDEEADIERVDGMEVFRAKIVDPTQVVRPLLEHPELKQVVESYFGTGFKAGFAMAIQYQHLNEDEEEKVIAAGRTRKWHFGSEHPPNGIRLQVLLTDQEKDGALYVVNNTDTRRLLSEKSFEYIRTHPDYVMDRVDVQEFYGKKGSARLFESSRQLHRGGGPSKDHERMIVIFELQPDFTI